jgi:mono/diheme cytochrome c family protein
MVADVTTERILNADKEPQNWLTVNKDYASHRYSERDQINKGNVKDLGSSRHFKYSSSRRAPEGPPLAGGRPGMGPAPSMDTGFRRYDEGVGNVNFTLITLAALSMFGCVFLLAPGFAGAAEARNTEQNAAAAEVGPATSEAENSEAKLIFAGQCSWCHGSYGMTADKGPRLAGTQMTQRQVEERIRNGKEGLMPSFRKFLDDAQIALMARYIKSLKP